MISGLVVLMAMLGVASTPRSDDICLLVGQYEYTKYQYVLKSGEKGGLEQLGAKSVTLDIRSDMRIKMAMMMHGDFNVVQEAQIVELEIKENKGYWIVKWPDLPSPVKSDLELSGNSLVYVSDFLDRSDIVRFGMREFGTLQRDSQNEGQKACREQQAP